MSAFTIRRSAVIPASASTLFERVNDFHRWVDWSPWETLDADLQRSYSGPDAGVGATYGWSGKKAGAGSMRITEASAPADAAPGRIEIDLRFTKPMQANNVTVFTFTPQGDGTLVEWAMSGVNDTLFKRLFAKVFSMDKMVGRDFEKGLAALEKAVAA
ncbi:SRPBCC family protein [Micrococcales bacterium 31B]|nr:SRPBCC family protein [Micrococcales bacterium 31B]